MTGQTVPKNLEHLVDDAQREQLLSGPCFWEHSKLEQEHNLASHFKSHKVNVESLESPSYGDYRLPHLNF